MKRIDDGGVSIPEQVKAADILTQYAVQTRYPGMIEEVSQHEYQEALDTANMSSPGQSQ